MDVVAIGLQSLLGIVVLQVMADDPGCSITICPMFYQGVRTSIRIRSGIDYVPDYNVGCHLKGLFTNVGLYSNMYPLRDES